MSKLTAAVVGTGFIGPVHVEGLRRAGIAIAGILGSTFEKSETAAAKLGLPRAYRDLDELLSDRDVDVVLSLRFALGEPTRTGSSARPAPARSRP